MTDKNSQIIEQGFSTEPLSDKEIHSFCVNDIRYAGISFGADRRLLEKALKSICEISPSARASLRATIYNIRQQQKTNHNYKLDVNITTSGPQNMNAMVDSSEPNKINIHLNTIRNSIKSIQKIFDEMAKKSLFLITDSQYQNAESFMVGSYFLHEAQHVRQLQVKDILAQTNNLQLLDAAPQALTRQIAVESQNIYLIADNGISKKEIDQYLRSQNKISHASRMQQAYGNDFIAPIADKPHLNHGQLFTKWIYTRDAVFMDLLIPEVNKEKKTGTALASYLENVNHLKLPKKDPTKKELSKYFAPQIKEIFNHATKEDRALLYGLIRLNKKPKQSDFSSPKAYQSSLKLFLTLQDINTDMRDLSILSPRVYEGNIHPQFNDFKQEAQKIRQRLKQKYGITISEFNKKGDKIAHRDPSSSKSSTASNNQSGLLSALTNNASVSSDTPSPLKKDISRTA